MSWVCNMIQCMYMQYMAVPDGLVGTLGIRKSVPPFFILTERYTAGEAGRIPSLLQASGSNYENML